MKIILLQDIKGIGRKYDVKDVSVGYARNFLIPKGLARVADERALKELESKRTAYEKERREKVERLKKFAGELAKSPLKFKAKVSKGEHLFGSVSAADIEEELKKKGLRDFEVKLEHPIKTLGTHNAEVDLGEGVKTKISVVVESD